MMFANRRQTTLVICGPNEKKRRWYYHVIALGTNCRRGEIKSKKVTCVLPNMGTVQAVDLLFYLGYEITPTLLSSANEWEVTYDYLCFRVTIRKEKNRIVILERVKRDEETNETEEWGETNRNEIYLHGQRLIMKSRGNYGIFKKLTGEDLEEFDEAISVDTRYVAMDTRGAPGKGLCLRIGKVRLFSSL